MSSFSCSMASSSSRRSLRSSLNVAFTKNSRGAASKSKTASTNSTDFESSFRTLPSPSYIDLIASLLDAPSISTDWSPSWPLPEFLFSSEQAKSAMVSTSIGSCRSANICNLYKHSNALLVPPASDPFPSEPKFMKSASLPHRPSKSTPLIPPSPSSLSRSLPKAFSSTIFFTACCLYSIVFNSTQGCLSQTSNILTPIFVLQWFNTPKIELFSGDPPTITFEIPS
mmetsp:Transcript_7182/g.13654  ORF Transcript_7182/g.13654 Transcript_7182/m.13654 type:complete len:226 (+) Transcript_7182:1472-2149(+)